MASIVKLVWCIWILHAWIGVSSGHYNGWEEYIENWWLEEEASQLYPFSEEYLDSVVNSGDGVDAQINFTLPFYGRSFSSAYISPSGYIELSNTQPATWHPKNPRTVWPNQYYPADYDPPMVAPYIAQYELPGYVVDDPGKLFWRILDPEEEHTEVGKEIDEGMLSMLSLEVQGHVLGAERFWAQYGLIVTWSEIRFLGCTQNTCPANMLQAAVISDGMYTYVVYNYYTLEWIGGVNQGYDTETGEQCLGDCIPAQAGFNAGDGVAFYSLPYSLTDNVRMLADISGTGVKGRFIYGVHSFDIIRGGCSNESDIDPVDWPIQLNPGHGTMLGGDTIYISGPCFMPSLTPIIHCKFGDITVEGSLLHGDHQKAMCVTPFVTAIGHMRFELSVNGEETWPYKGWFEFDMPNALSPHVSLDLPELWYERTPGQLGIHWNPQSLENIHETRNNVTPVEFSIDIMLHGYFETEVNNATQSELVLLQTLQEDVENSGEFIFDSVDYECPGGVDCEWGIPLPVGIISVTRRDTGPTPKRIWSEPFPLGWYTDNAWEESLGPDWAEQICQTWLEQENQNLAWQDDLRPCPATKMQAQTDLGHFMIGFDCNITWPICPKGPQQNIVCYDQVTPHGTIWPPASRCCYDEAGNLLNAGDHDTGIQTSTSCKASPHGNNQSSHGNIPFLSHYCWDIVFEALCCKWTEDPIYCQDGYMKARRTPNITDYKVSKFTAVYGDPHFRTYDGVEYMFNGRGEYWLLRANDMQADLDNFNLQARMEKPKDQIWGEVRATVMTAIAMQEGYAYDMTIPRIEVAVSLPYSEVDLTLLVNGEQQDLRPEPHRMIYVPYRDNTRRITLWNNEVTPHPFNRQNNITITFPSGITVQAAYKHGALHVITGLPDRYKEQTRGLFGLWNGDIEDDLTTPGGGIVDYTLGAEHIHIQFGEKWVIQAHMPQDSRFTYRGNLTSNDYHDPNFVPHFSEPVLPPNSSITEEEVDAACGGNFVCRFDYKTTFSRDLAQHSEVMEKWTQNIINMSAPVPVCGYLEVPYSRREVTHYRVGGTITFTGCATGYTLQGHTQYTCQLIDGTTSWQPESNTICKANEKIASENKKLIIAIVVPICVVCLAVGLGVGGYFIHKKRKEKAQAAHGYPTQRPYSTGPAGSLGPDGGMSVKNFEPTRVARPVDEPHLLFRGQQQASTLAGSGDLGSFSSSEQLDGSSSPGGTTGLDFSQMSALGGLISLSPDPDNTRLHSQSDNYVSQQNRMNESTSSRGMNLAYGSRGFEPTMESLSHSQASINYNPQGGYGNDAYSQHNTSVSSINRMGNGVLPQNVHNQSAQGLNISVHSLNQLQHLHGSSSLNQSTQNINQAPMLTHAHNQSQHSINPFQHNLNASRQNLTTSQQNLNTSQMNLNNSRQNLQGINTSQQLNQSAHDLNRSAQSLNRSTQNLNQPGNLNTVPAQSMQSIQEQPTGGYFNKGQAPSTQSINLIHLSLPPDPTTTTSLGAVHNGHDNVAMDFGEDKTDLPLTPAQRFTAYAAAGYSHDTDV